MRYLLLFLSTSLFYMELVYHIITQRGLIFSVLFLVPVILLVSSLESVVISLCPKKAGRIVFYVILGLEFIFYAAQLVYYSIFKQPLLFAAVGNAGMDAVTNYWREALTGILNNWYGIILLFLPIVLGIFLDKKAVFKFDFCDAVGAVISFFWGVVACCLAFVIMGCGYYTKAEYYTDYQEYYDSLMLVEGYGLSPVMLRSMIGDILPEVEEVQMASGTETVEEIPVPEVTETPKPTEEPEEAPEPVMEEKIDTSPQVLPVDMAKLSQVNDSKEWQELVEAFESMEATNKNEYTGMFAGYNLIYLTAEGFSPYAVSKELTPTLYELLNSGIVASNYYVPLWQTSTSDGEYVNLTGLIPNQQFSMKRSGENEQPFSLGAYFAKEGVKSYAFHNGSLSYYDRYISHNNMGYDFMASTLGSLPEEEWGHKVFPMENADYWPASDLDMMKATIPYFINEERFNVYYMTISGHLNYSFQGNRMSSKNRDFVKDLPYSTEGKAYIACNIELDRALEYLIQELKKAGKLEKTVIVLSADHYPYGMNVDNYEELAGMELENTLDIYRNGLIFWNSEMETIEVDKPSCSVDILPTIYNLFGFEYDSRLYAGKDILSDSEGMVIFANQSVITDKMEYNKKTKEVNSRNGEAVEDEYLSEIRKKVKTIYNYSAGILNQDFYKYVKESMIEPQ